MTATASFEFTEVGTGVLPEQHRDTFLALLRGDPVPSQGWSGDTPVWRSPNGTMPMSPGLGLQTVVSEFGIRPVTAVSYNMAYEAHDTTGEPGRFGDFTATYTVLGVRTRKQAIYFLDGGARITPVLIETLSEPATLID